MKSAVRSTLECGGSTPPLVRPRSNPKAVAAATALQGAARIFILSGEPRAHGRLCGMAPLSNATFTSPAIYAFAKRVFSKNGCFADNVGSRG